MNHTEHMQHQDHVINKKTSITPLLIILGLVVAASVLLSYFQGNINEPMLLGRNFMGIFFLTFSGFKLLDVKGFAEAYATYDVIAKKIYAYGYAYPFIELWLGINYLFGLIPYATDWITLVVMTISSIGVLLALMSKKPFRCACLGTRINVPMTTVTLIEDLLMAAMAAAMLLFAY